MLAELASDVHFYWMITRLPMLLALTFPSLGALASPARAQRRVAEERAPKALVAQILRDNEAAGYLFLRDELAAGGWLAIIQRVDLDGDGTPELFVEGRDHVCGAANCAGWVYRVTARGYEQLIFANGVISIEARKTVSHGYRDILTTTHDGVERSDLTFYQFDGKRYRAARCFQSQEGYFDAQHSLRWFKRPRLTRVSCDA